DFQAHLDQRSINTHDANKVASWFAEDAVQLRVATGQLARGKEAIRAATQEIFNAFPDFHVKVRDLFSDGKSLCIECIFTRSQEGVCVGIAPTHRRSEAPTCLIFKCGDHCLFVSETAYMDAATMLRQLGLMPG